MKFVTKFVKTMDAISEVFGEISMYLVILTVAIGFYNVAARYIGKFIGLTLSSNVFIELQWYLYSLVFFLGFAYILKHDVNVRVDFFYERFSKKVQATINFWGNLLFMIPFSVVGIMVTVPPVLYSWGRLPNGTWGTWEMSPDPSGLPRAPIKSMIIVSFVALTLQFVAEVIKSYIVMRGHTLEEYGLQEIHEEAEIH